MSAWDRYDGRWAGKGYSSKTMDSLGKKLEESTKRVSRATALKRGLGAVGGLGILGTAAYLYKKHKDGQVKTASVFEKIAAELYDYNPRTDRVSHVGPVTAATNAGDKVVPPSPRMKALPGPKRLSARGKAVLGAGLFAAGTALGRATASRAEARKARKGQVKAASTQFSQETLEKIAKAFADMSPEEFGKFKVNRLRRVSRVKQVAEQRATAARSRADAAGLAHAYDYQNDAKRIAKNNANHFADQAEKSLQKHVSLGQDRLRGLAKADKAFSASNIVKKIAFRKAA